MGCVFPNVDRLSGMLASTLVPVAIALLMQARFAIKHHLLKKRQVEQTSLAALEQGHYSLLLMLAYGVFPGTSKSIFETFA